MSVRLINLAQHVFDLIEGKYGEIDIRYQDYPYERQIFFDGYEITLSIEHPKFPDILIQLYDNHKLQLSKTVTSVLNGHHFLDFMFENYIGPPGGDES